MKTFEVNIDMKFSTSKRVKAKSKYEAKKKAWEKFLKRVPKSMFRIYVDEL